MQFYSTNKNAPKVSFETALMTGLAPDGGLYFPDSFPEYTPQELTNLIHANIVDVGVSVMKKWVNNAIDYTTLNGLMKNALNFPIKLKNIGPYYVLELFHGPTLSFKDIASRTLAQFISYYVEKQNKKITLLVATSGDTGGAIAQAFTGIENIQVVILYPKGKVNPLQEEQMTRAEKNIHPVAVDGVYEDCQTLLKQAFDDGELNDLNLSSANSISIGRLLPQIIYYVYAYTLLNSESLQFIVPSGNMGNITAGLFAAEMNLPVTDFITAFNANDPIVNYYKTGEYAPQKTVATISNSMDTGNPSNVARIMELFENSHETFKAYIKADSVSDRDTIETIKRIYLTYNYLLDPHTAVAWATAERLVSTDKVPVILATASPVKFVQEIKKATGIEISNEEELAKLKSHQKRGVEMKNDYAELKKLLQHKI